MFKKDDYLPVESAKSISLLKLNLPLNSKASVEINAVLLFESVAETQLLHSHVIVGVITGTANTAGSLDWNWTRRLTVLCSLPT